MTQANIALSAISSIGSVITTVSNIALVAGNITPPQIATAYKMPISSGAGAKVGIVSLGGGWLPSDLQSSMSNLGITLSQNITTVLVDGATNTFSTNDNNSSLENTLDLYCVAGIAPAANITIYIGKNTLSSFANVINRAVNENCDIITISWGQDEIYGNGDFLSAPLANAAAKGITVLAASGDFGAEGGSDFYGIPTVNYPASSPNVVAVGGTDLYLNPDNSILYEFGDSQSGGGVSSVFPTPIWQQGLTLTTLPDNATYDLYNDFGGRGVPDLSAPFQSYAFWYNGNIISGVAGTSASTPIIAGLIARYKSLVGYRLGLITRDYLYNNPTAFNDTIYGDNVQPDSIFDFGYQASLGWDPVTGLGSPNGNLLYSALRFPPRYPVAKYGKGVTWIKTSDGTWKPVKGLWQKTDATTWTPVTRANLKVNGTTWESVYPTPRGVVTATPSSLTFNPYLHHTEPDNDPDGGTSTATFPVTLQNTGDYDLLIEALIINNSASYSVETTHSDSFPILLTPMQTTNIGVRVKGLAPGNFTGNIQVQSNVGVLGEKYDPIPMTVNVRPDYSNITFSPNPVKLRYYYQDVDPSVVTLTSGSGTYTVPTNVTRIGVTITGGGGGGGGASGNEEPVNGGGGGGGGAVYTNANITVTSGQTFSYSVGGGGAGGGVGSDGSAGGTTTFGANTASGGGGGSTSGAGGSPNGGAGESIGDEEADAAGGRGGAPNGGAGGGYSEGAEVGYGGNSGGNGSIVITQYPKQITANAVVTITNSGNGANLLIYSNAISGNHITVNTLPTNIGYNFNTFSGNTGTFTVAAANLNPGVYNDTITVTSNSLDNPTYVLPVVTTVLVPAGRQLFDTPGSYNWIVPDSVHHLDILAVGGGGAGGPGIDGVLEGGGGGGGGSGGYQYSTRLRVTPGETLTVNVGDGGGSKNRPIATYFPVTLSYAWSYFMNSYAVWTHPDGVSPVNVPVNSQRIFTAPANGYYTFQAQADNYLEVYADGALILTTGEFGSEYPESANVYLHQGARRLSFNASNYGGPAGFAVTITDAGNNQLWNTRTLLDPSVGTTGGTTTVTGSFGTINVLGGLGGSSAYNSGVVYTGNYGDTGTGQDNSDSSGGGGGGCFLPHTLIRMANGTEKRISQIQIGDYVLEALTNKPARVIGVKTRAHDVNKWVFALHDDEMPYMTEEHPWYNDDNELCAISTLCTEQAPWLGDVHVVDVKNKIKLSQDVVVYNLMLETGESHYANGIRVSNIVKTGGTYVLVYKGLLSQEAYQNHVWNESNSTVSPAARQRIFDYTNKLATYLLENDNFKSRLIGRLMTWAVNNRSTLEPIGIWWFKSKIRKVIFGKRA